MQRAAIFVDVLSIRRGVQKGRVDLERAEQLRSFRSRRAIGAVDHHAQPRQVRRNTAREPANVSLAQAFLAGNARNLGSGIRRRNRIRIQQRENLFFNRQFARVRQLVAIAGKNLDPVIGPRIVRSRNHDPGIEPLRARQERDARCGDHASAARFHAHRRQPLQKTVGDPSTGDARVLSNHHPRLGLHAHQIVPQRPPNPINTVARQREFPRHATNPVSTEELSGLRHGQSLVVSR